jgi:hypothetical protein
MPSNMVSAAFGPLGVALHNASSPTDSEWADWMRIVYAIPVAELRILVFTDGGAPTTLQRGQFTDHLAGRAVPISVVSSSRLARGVATAISWFNPQIKVYPPAEIQQAFAHAGLRGGEPDELLRSIVVAARALDSGSPKVLTQVVSARTAVSGGAPPR